MRKFFYIILIIIHFFFIKSFAYAESEDVHKSNVNQALAGYLILILDDNYENTGDALVSKEEYENCLTPLKKFNFDGFLSNKGDCADTSIYLLEIEGSKNLELWDFEYIDLNKDSFIEIAEFYQHLMNDNPHGFFEPSVSYEMLDHSITFPNIEKAIEYDWRWKLINYNEIDSDDFINETIDHPSVVDEYDWEYNGSVAFYEFKLIEYFKDFISYIYLTTTNEDFKSNADFEEESYIEILAELNGEVSPSGNDGSLHSNGISKWSEYRGKWYDCSSYGQSIVSGTTRICLASCYYYDQVGTAAEYVLTGIFDYLNEYQNCSQSALSIDWSTVTEDQLLELGLW